METSKALIGRYSICEYLRVSKAIFYDLVKNGMPVKKDGSRWIGHKDILDDYFHQKLISSTSAKHT